MLNGVVDMKVRLKSQVYVRHAGNESAIVAPRTEGCTVMVNALPFLEKLNSTWCDVDEIVHHVVSTFACTPKEIIDDVGNILDELAMQGFIVCEGCETTKCYGGRLGERIVKTENLPNETDGGMSPFGDFCKRHGVVAELHMDLTDRCNEACVHCYIPKGGGTLMPTELALKLLHEFRAGEGLTVFFSGGECMLHPGFEMILREARRLDLNIVVLSNVVLCDNRMVDLLKEIEPQFVNVSLYSMTAAEHDSITRVSGSWERTMTAIHALKTAGVHVRLATPLMRVNRDAADALLAFARREGMHDVLDCDIIGRMDHDCSNQACSLSVEEVEAVIRRYKAELCHGRLDVASCTPDVKVCEIGELKLNVNAAGDYYPCDGFHGMVLGNAMRDTLADVWRGERLNRLRSLRNRDFVKCVKCENRPWCKVCPMRNFNETGDMFSSAPVRCAVTAIHRKVWEEK